MRQFKFIGVVVTYFYVAVLLALSSCGEKEAPRVALSTVAPKVEEVKEESALPEEFRYETYGDKDIFSTPRIQFASEPGSESERILFSMKVDGSDRRLVAGRELLFHSVMVHTPIRSPNNRYVALSMSGPDGFFRALIDLKEQTSIKLTNGGGLSSFQLDRR